MSDRLALSNAIEDAGIERAKVKRIASTIVGDEGRYLGRRVPRVREAVRRDSVAK